MQNSSDPEAASYHIYRLRAAHAGGSTPTPSERSAPYTHNVSGPMDTSTSSWASPSPAARHRALPYDDVTRGYEQEEHEEYGVTWQHQHEQAHGIGNGVPASRDIYEPKADGVSEARKGGLHSYGQREEGDFPSSSAVLMEHQKAPYHRPQPSSLSDDSIDPHRLRKTPSSPFVVRSAPVVSLSAQEKTPKRDGGVASVARVTSSGYQRDDMEEYPAMEDGEGFTRCAFAHDNNPHFSTPQRIYSSSVQGGQSQSQQQRNKGRSSAYSGGKMVSAEEDVHQYEDWIKQHNGEKLRQYKQQQQQQLRPSEMGLVVSAEPDGRTQRSIEQDKEKEKLRQRVTRRRAEIHNGTYRPDYEYDDHYAEEDNRRLEELEHKYWSTNCARGDGGSGKQQDIELRQEGSSSSFNGEEMMAAGNDTEKDTIVQMRDRMLMNHRGGKSKPSDDPAHPSNSPFYSPFTKTSERRADDGRCDTAGSASPDLLDAWNRNGHGQPEQQADRNRSMATTATRTLPVQKSKEKTKGPIPSPRQSAGGGHAILPPALYGLSPRLEHIHSAEHKALRDEELYKVYRPHANADTGVTTAHPHTGERESFASPMNPNKVRNGFVALSSSAKAEPTQQDHFYTYPCWPLMDSIHLQSPISASCACCGEDSGLVGYSSPASSSSPSQLGITRGDAYFATGHLSGTVNIYACTLGGTHKSMTSNFGARLVKSITHLHLQEVTQLVVHDSILFTGSVDGTVRKTEVASGRIIATFNVRCVDPLFIPSGARTLGSEVKRPWVQSKPSSVTCFHVDGNAIAIGTSSGGVVVFSVFNPGKPLAKLVSMTGDTRLPQNSSSSGFTSGGLPIVAIQLDFTSGIVHVVNSQRFFVWHFRWKSPRDADAEHTQEFMDRYHQGVANVSVSEVMRHVHGLEGPGSSLSPGDMLKDTSAPACDWYSRDNQPDVITCCTAGGLPVDPEEEGSRNGGEVKNVFWLPSPVIQWAAFEATDLLIASFSGWMYTVHRYAAGGQVYSSQQRIESGVVKMRDPETNAQIVRYLSQGSNSSYMVSGMNRNVAGIVDVPRVVAFDASGLMRVFAFGVNDDEFCRTMEDVESDPIPTIHHVVDIPLARFSRNRLRHANVFFDRFCLLATDMDMEVYSCKPVRDTGM